MRISEMHNAGIRPKTNAGVVLTGQRLGHWVVGEDQPSTPMEGRPMEPVTMLATSPAVAEPKSTTDEPVARRLLKKAKMSLIIW